MAIRRNILLFLLIILFMFSLILLYYSVYGDTDFFSGCDDKNKCTSDIKVWHKFNCLHELIEKCDGNKICETDEYGISKDCPVCNDANKCTNDSFNYITSECKYSKIAPCQGNNLCEEGEYGVLGDCPDCSDNKKCTQDFYDFSEKKCINNLIKGCCGNDLCESGENYSNCDTDCNVPISLKELTSDEVLKNYYNFNGNFVRVYGSVLSQNNITGHLGDYEGFTVHVIKLQKNIRFNERAVGFNVSLQCENQEGLKIEAKGNYGYSVLLKNNEPYVVIDDTFLICNHSSNCSSKQISNMVGINNAGRNGEGIFETQFLVNPAYSMDLNCKAKIDVLNPAYSSNFDFEISYLNS